MTDRLKITILGCGSSGGVPRIGNIWGACDPNNPKNRRRRCSILIERISKNGRTTVLVDSSPDMREQLLDADIQHLDAVLYTHEHADHVHGLDDLRMLFINNRKRIPTYATGEAKELILQRFAYAFEAPEESPYPPILEMCELTPKLTIQGAGGPLEIKTYPVIHGKSIVQAILVNGILYTPDIKAFYEDHPPWLSDLNLWIIDALRDVDHPTHFSLSEALHWIDTAKPSEAILTNLHIDLDYQRLLDETPKNVRPAFDGMVAWDAPLDA